jgi:hypothetical protein
MLPNGMNINNYQLSEKDYDTIANFIENGDTLVERLYYNFIYQKELCKLIQLEHEAQDLTCNTLADTVQIRNDFLQSTTPLF